MGPSEWGIPVVVAIIPGIWNPMRRHRAKNPVRVTAGSSGRWPGQSGVTSGYSVRGTRCSKGNVLAAWGPRWKNQSKS